MIDPSDLTDLDEFENDLPITALMTAMGDPMARYTVYYVSQESQVSLDLLADVVTGWTNAGSGTLASRGDRNRTRLLLYHVHLPVLDTLGVVTFDADARTVQAATHSPPLKSFLEWLKGLEQSRD